MTGSVAIVAVAMHLWPGEKPALQFARDAIANGEFWRLWSAHLLHLNASHLGWNLAVLVPAGAWAERAAPRRARILYVVAPAVIAVALLVFDPFLIRYAGLSGLAVGAVALLAFTQLGRSMGHDRWIWWGLIGLVAAKITTEFLLPETSLARFGGGGGVKPVPLAHIAGVASAALVHGSRRRFHVR